jgi:hypothetical protein
LKGKLLIKEYLRGYEEDVRTTVSYKVILESASPDTLLSLIEPYKSHSSWEVRRSMNVLAFLSARNETSPVIREKASRILVTGVLDEDKGNSKRNFQYLLRISRIEYFDDATKELIREAFFEKDPSSERILLVGVAGLKDMIPHLQEIVQQDPEYVNAERNWWFGTQQWCARCALARLGDKGSIEHCISMVESHEDADFRIMNLLKHLAYIRQPECMKILKKYLDSDEISPFAGKDVIRVKYALLVIPLLAPAMDGFPVEDKLSGIYDDEDLQKARSYMADEANWKIIR